MSTKRNHTPKVSFRMCSTCEHKASAPDGVKHRHCSGSVPAGKVGKGGQGKWIAPFERPMQKSAPA